MPQFLRDVQDVFCHTLLTPESAHIFPVSFPRQSFRSRRISENGIGIEFVADGDASKPRLAVTGCRLEGNTLAVKGLPGVLLAGNEVEYSRAEAAQRAAVEAAVRQARAKMAEVEEKARAEAAQRAAVEAACQEAVAKRAEEQAASDAAAAVLLAEVEAEKARA